MIEPALLGTVQDVDGPTISINIEPDLPTGILFVDGEAHSAGQVGGFVRIELGFVNLVGVITRAGAGAVPGGSEPTTSSRWITVQLVGESVPGRAFARGVARLPSIGSRAFIVTEVDLERIYGQGTEADGLFSVGRVAAALSITARIDFNRLVTRHSAVVGSTGSGKSTTVAKIAEVLANAEKLPAARAILFDLHGEYARSLGSKANVFALASDTASVTELNVPFWALSFDELIPLTFGSLNDDAGRAYVRDEIVRLKRGSFLTVPRAGLTVADITVDTPVPFSLRQLWFDLYNYLNATHYEPSSGQSAATRALELDASGSPIEPGDAQRLIAPHFAPQNLSSAGRKVYLSGATLNIRRNVDILLSRLKDARFNFVLDPGPWAPDAAGNVATDLDALLESWLGGEHAATIVDLSGVPQDVVQDVVGSMSRLVYDAMFWSRLLSEGARERPLLMIFEEAHSYLGASSSGSAKMSVQRIVREGRKYGVGAMIVSQRPSELDPTVLSQCGTLISMRLTNSVDRQIVARSAADNLDGMFALLPVLRTGEALIVGESVPIPTRAIIDRPGDPPDSADPILVGTSERPGGWDKRREPADYAAVAQAWRSQNPKSIELIVE